VHPVVRRLYSGAFMTDVGVRCRSNEHARLMPYSDYHGSHAVWAKQSFDVAAGLRAQRFGRLAHQLECRILNGVNIAGKHYEFFYVDSDGSVHFDPECRRPPSERLRTLFGTNVPEDVQAWTVSAVQNIKRRMRACMSPNGADGNGTSAALEQECLAAVPPVPLLASRPQIARVAPAMRTFHVDLERGRSMDREYQQRQFGEA